MWIGICWTVVYTTGAVTIKSEFRKLLIENKYLNFYRPPLYSQKRNSLENTYTEKKFVGTLLPRIFVTICVIQLHNCRINRRFCNYKIVDSNKFFFYTVFFFRICWFTMTLINYFLWFFNILFGFVIMYLLYKYKRRI